MNQSRLPPLGALRAFVAVARLQSFKAAATELFVTPTAVSHQIRQLEAHLGVRVLDRSPRSVTLTAAGQVLYDTSASAFAQIERSAFQIRRRPGHPILTLSATPAFLSQWLVPRLSDLRRSLPDLELRLHASDQVMDLQLGGVDVAIRYGRRRLTSDAVALCQDAFAPVCSPSLGLKKLRDLNKVNLIHIDGRVAPRPDPNWSRWCEHAGASNLNTRRGIRFTDSLHAVQAAIAGQGIAIVSLVLARDALDCGLLVQPFAHQLQGSTYHFVSAESAGQQPEVSQLRKWFQHATVS